VIVRAAFNRLSERQIFFGARAKYLYEVIGWVFRNETDVRFMNYGYSDGQIEAALSLPDEAEPERYSAQLYHAVAAQAPLQGKRVLDVGSGRGGGAAHIHRWFGPRETVGCDIAHQAVAFCRRVHCAIDGLRFIEGNATALPFKDAEFDAVTNIESSHCYPDRETFFRQAHRVLRPGGALLYADFTPPRRDPVEARGALVDEIAEAGFGAIEVEDITARILAGLDADDARRQREIGLRFPLGTRWFAHLWAGTKKSWIYRDFAEGRRAYLMVRAQAMPLRPLPRSLVADVLPSAVAPTSVVA
jgi:SAM-dependent methyltransferase